MKHYKYLDLTWEEGIKGQLLVEVDGLGGVQVNVVHDVPDHLLGPGGAALGEWWDPDIVTPHLQLPDLLLIAEIACGEHLETNMLGDPVLLWQKY